VLWGLYWKLLSGFNFFCTFQTQLQIYEAQIKTLQYPSCRQLSMAHKNSLQEDLNLIQSICRYCYISNKINQNIVSYFVQCHRLYLRKARLYKSHDTESFFKYPIKQIIASWPESASELYWPSDHWLSAKLAPTFADRGCHIVSVTEPHGRNLGFLWNKWTSVPNTEQVSCKICASYAPVRVPISTPSSKTTDVSHFYFILFYLFIAFLQSTQDT
jgi:hypothetical protein